MKTADPGTDARDQSLPCHGRDPPLRAGLPGRDLRTHRTQPHHRLRDHGGAARRPADRSRARRRGARRRPRAGRGSCCKLNPDAAHVVGVKLAPGPDHRRGHQFLRRRRLRRSRCRSASTARPRRSSPTSSRTACAAASATPGSRCRRSPASASGFPASSSARPGVCRQSPILQERDVPFGADLARRLGVPASIDSDVNLVALAEHWFGQARDLNDFLVVNVERSLGLGILHNGELFRGANGLSPDLGDFMLRSPGDGRRTPRRRRVRGLGARRGRGAMRVGDRDAPAQPDRLMASLIQRATDGDARLRPRARQGGRGARLRHRQPHHPVRAAESDHFRAARWRRASISSRRCARRSRRCCRRAWPTSSDIVVREWSERHLGARARRR